MPLVIIGDLRSSGVAGRRLLFSLVSALQKAGSRLVCIEPALLISLLGCRVALGSRLNQSQMTLNLNLRRSANVAVRSGAGA
ncbi:hypothetical protein C8Q70DRAFT_1005714 [Cubamyces menziesii]|nr:hypothetical protein C8Q70DRAFT_1005714 [Cubamyces menziesii]